MRGENPSNHVFVDRNAKRQRNDVCDARTAESRISLVDFDSRVERYISDAPLYRPVLLTLMKLAPESAPETQYAADWLALWEDGLKDAADQGQIDTRVSTVLVAHTIRNAYLGLLQRWVMQQVTDQQFKLETEATISMMLAGIAKKPADRKHWQEQFIKTQARLLKVSMLDQ